MGKKGKESSKRTHYIIFPRVITKAIIITYYPALVQMNVSFLQSFRDQNQKKGKIRCLDGCNR